MAAQREQQSAADQERWQTEMTLLQRRLGRRDAEISWLRADSHGADRRHDDRGPEVRQTAGAVHSEQAQWRTRCDELTQQLAASQAELRHNAQAWHDERAGLHSRAAEQERHAAEQSAAGERQQVEVRQQLTDREHELGRRQPGANVQESGDLPAALSISYKTSSLPPSRIWTSAREQMAALAATTQSQDSLAQQLADLTQQRQSLQDQAAAISHQREDLIAGEQQLAAQRERFTGEQRASAEQLHARELHLEQQTTELEQNLSQPMPG